MITLTYPVRVLLGVGTLLEPEFGQSAYQDMVITRAVDATLAPGQAGKRIAAVACLNRTKKLPGSDIQYLLSGRAPLHAAPGAGLAPGATPGRSTPNNGGARHSNPFRATHLP